MKENAVHFLLHYIIQHLYSGSLTGSKANDGSYLIVIMLATILDITVLSSFQKECIKAISHFDMIDRFGCVGKIHHTHQRMQGFQSVETVIVIYII